MPRQEAASAMRPEPRPYLHPRVSPDGTHIALWLEADDAPDTADVWTYDLASHQLTRRTTGGASWRPVWSPDGHTLVMSQMEPDTERDLYLVNVDTRETQALEDETGDEGGAAVSPSGRWVAYVWRDLNTAGIYAVSTHTDHPTRVRLAVHGREPRWSLDAVAQRLRRPNRHTPWGPARS